MRAHAAILLASLVAACAPRHSVAHAPSAPNDDVEWRRLPGHVRFLGDSDELDLRSRFTLESAVRRMQDHADVRRLRVTGHAESQIISEARARHVADILVGMGVPRAMIEIGSEIAGDAGPGERRVELRVLVSREP